MVWIILLIGSVGLALFLERLLYYHRAQINTTEFINGVKNVLKRENIVEAISICDATPGPIPRLVKVAILNKDNGRERLKDAIQEAGMLEIPQLGMRLDTIATIAQLSPMLGLLGTVLGFASLFELIQQHGMFIHPGLFAGNVWQALASTAVGLAVSIVCHACHNLLVKMYNNIVSDMEKVSVEIVNIISDLQKNQ